jgi:ADP-heptose:LPS heptosyltransferase
VLPEPVHSALRPWWRRLFRFNRRAREWWIPFIAWVVWLVFQCVRCGKRAVVICRSGGIGDVLCTLPICHEARRRHPGKLLIFVTAAIWREVVVMSRSADLVYANRRWVHPLTMPTRIRLFGLVDTIYNPQKTGERVSDTFGTSAHLIEDFAESCGFRVTAPRLPNLSPSSHLIEKTRVAYGLDHKTIGDRLLIGINAGPNWRVKEWPASKWQALINTIHAEYAAVIIQFGIRRDGESSEYDNLTGVKSVAGRLRGEELVALIAICDLVISIDSGPVHVAGAVDTPVLGLFGPLDPLSILPSDARALGLFSDVPCRFCHNRTPVIHWFNGCPNDIACMKRLDCETVFGAIQSMLGRNTKREFKESLTVFE